MCVLLGPNTISLCVDVIKTDSDLRQRVLYFLCELIVMRQYTKPLEHQAEGRGVSALVCFSGKNT